MCNLNYSSDNKKICVSILSFFVHSARYSNKYLMTLAVGPPKKKRKIYKVEYKCIATY